MSGSLDYFLPYQMEWIDCDAPMALVEKSRRIGFTYAESYRSVERRLRLGTNHYFSSADLSAAKEFVDYCELWAKVFACVARNLGQVIIDEEEGIRAYVLEFENGAKIVAGSSNPKFFRSKGGDATLDEFAFHPQARELLKAAIATAIVWGHQLRILSTHNGEGSFFNHLVQEGRRYMAWKAARDAGQSVGPYEGLKMAVQRVTLADAVGQGLVEKLKQTRLRLGTMPPPDEGQRQAWVAEVRASCPDESTWLEEFMCTPGSDEVALLNYEMIRAAVAADLQLCTSPADLLASRHYYAGYDVGRRHDLSVLWVLERVGDVYWTRMLRVMQQQSFAAQESLLEALMSHRGVRRLCIDQTGIGMQLAERMKDRWGWRVEGVSLSGPVKHSLGSAFRDLFAERLIRIPAQVDWDAPGESQGQGRRLGARGDWLVEDLHKTRKVITAAGNVRLAADRDAGGHADAFWAGALAREAAEAAGKPLLSPKGSKPVGW